MTKLTDLPNIGTTMAGRLASAGIADAETLRQIGSREAFRKLRAVDPGACLSALSALEGAVRGIRWHNLPPEVKKDLKLFLKQLRNNYAVKSLSQ
ncbi:MAG TPA: TfoX/Sxy family protein [Methylomusa anaerophila]|uniref:TfoX C-terminal domain-containing protein n=1 Tax=Methylomusa anaerophila TaxID=1930071 RepID=A0A348AFR0_9FIRM|nr:TfoX/Sxy family protein [Methylomusa anaerophila]BBB89908.1 hypothetical protein MAMMFC1_00548 [Methylomusa anaerophila]HML90568.1 TfoX/Sxy family protein [Methylomusa anaerophila]